jgi:hypothetical protein
MKRILALDLGTTFGWCYGTSTGDMTLGSVRLAYDREIKGWAKERMDRRCDPRIPRFYQWLNIGRPDPDIIIFEDVQFVSGRKQAHLWASYRTAVWLRFQHGFSVECLDTGKLKAHACDGCRTATKEMMVASACKNPRFRALPTNPFCFIDNKSHNELDDNAADAYHLFTWALQNLTRA